MTLRRFSDLFNQNVSRLGMTVFGGVGAPCEEKKQWGINCESITALIIITPHHPLQRHPDGHITN